LDLRENENETQKAALIRMPTGSGKTGIMALIANCELQRPL
jgi:superfamily II DNA or RNA helicase